MASKYGATHSLPGYDRFRTGLTYADVKRMLWDESEDRADWRYKRRGTVLGHWHQLKMEMYEQAVARGLLEGKDHGPCRTNQHPVPARTRRPNPRKAA